MLPDTKKRKDKKERQRVLQPQRLTQLNIDFITHKKTNKKKKQFSADFRCSMNAASDSRNETETAIVVNNKC